jgi:SAM-dependent methyltransferase
VQRAVRDLGVLAQDGAVLQDGAFSERVAALDELDFVCDVLRVSGSAAREDLGRAEALRAVLAAANAVYCEQLRNWLQGDAWTPAALRTELDRHTGYGRDTGALHLEQEPVDRLLDGILQLSTFRGTLSLVNRDYVHLEDSPARVLLDLVDHVPFAATDCFCDLGSGLGRAAILVHWLTGVTAQGIEVQPDYAAFAMSLAVAFGLERVRFHCADAATADLSRGTVFYLFTPFKGNTLRQVWRRLKAEAQTRGITVCTYGAVSLAAAQETWLVPASGALPHEFALAVWRTG